MNDNNFEPLKSNNLEYNNLASNNLESNNLESNNLESNNLESNNLESNNLESNNLESNNLESNNLESNNLESNNLESNNLESNNLESNKIIMNINKEYKNKKKFEKECTHCNKILKNIKSYEHHVNTQVCYSYNEISYCKLCKLLLSNHNDYIKHLLSMEHINKIGCDNLEVLNSNQPSSILQADPYLTNNEARSIGTNNLGNKFTFVFNNNNTQIINLVSNNEINPHNINPNNINSNDTNTNANINANMNANINANMNANTNDNNINANTNDNNINANMNDNNINANKKIIPTQKQLKILNILSNIEVINDGIKALITILDNKLKLEDYNGLQYIIKNDNNMKLKYKTAYLETIDKYIAMLVKKRANGETTYKDKDITKLVISLTTI
jgi:hypothetical protein